MGGRFLRLYRGLPGKGLPYLNQKRNGDLLVEILVKTPTNLSARQEELLREFESALAKEALPLAASVA